MPEVSQIGFGTNDYATVAAWEAGEATSSYGGNPPVAEIGAGTPALTANVQIRDLGGEWQDGFIIRAAAGQEFDGNFGGTHAVLNGGGFNLDIRVANGQLRNLEFNDVGFGSTGDNYDNLTIDSCGIRPDQLFLDKLVTNPVTITNTIILLETGLLNRAYYTNGTAANISNCTIIGEEDGGDLGTIYIRNNNSTTTINDTACYSDGATFEIHSGDTPTVTGDYNAGNDALMPSDGGNSISTLSTADFENYATRDLRIKNTSQLVGAGTGGGNIGAFVQAAALNITGTPAEVKAAEAFDVVVADSTTAPTVGNANVRFTDGTGPQATVNSVTGSGPWTINCTFPKSTPLLFSDVGYGIYVEVAGEEDTSSNVPYRPETGQTWVDVGTPVVTSEIYTQYAGTNFVSGDQLVHDTNTTPTSSIVLTVFDTTEFMLSSSPAVDQTADIYRIAANGTIDVTDTITFLAGIGGTASHQPSAPTQTASGTVGFQGITGTAAHQPSAPTQTASGSVGTVSADEPANVYRVELIKCLDIEPIDPDSQDSYGIEWAGELLTGETITGQSWILPSTISRGTSSDIEIGLYLSGSVTGVYLKDAEENKTHQVTNRITTSYNRTLDASLNITTAQK